MPGPYYGVQPQDRRDSEYRYSYLATNGQTVFNAIYSVDSIDVYVNGSHLRPEEFSASNGTSITLGTAAALNDEVVIVAQKITPVMGAVSPADLASSLVPYAQDIDQAQADITALNSGKADLGGNSSQGFLTSQAAQFDNSFKAATTSFVHQAIANPLNTAANLSWDSSTDTYTTNTLGLSTVTNTHLGMRRCLLKADGSVNYYLHATDSSLKDDGVTASILTGADGNVMVEIPAFYVKYSNVGVIHNWAISSVPREGFVLHPAFVKAGLPVPYRYISAYDVCVNTTGSTYQSGLNWDSNIGVNLNWNVSTAKLASVSGYYPAVGAKRSDFRSMAANIGVGFSQVDYYLYSAIQLLYLIEYQSFRSQNFTGNGNIEVATGYPVSSGVQTDSPHSAAGKSNSIGNASGYVNSTTRDTAWMSYRGIENLYGNCWNFGDGFNILLGIPYACGDYRNFADDTATNYLKVGSSMPTASGGYITNFMPFEAGFIPSNVTGGSSTSFVPDACWTALGSNCVLRFGGNAGTGALVGLWAVSANDLSSYLNRPIGARISF